MERALSIPVASLYSQPGFGGINMTARYFGLIMLLSLVVISNPALAKDAELQASRDNTLYQSTSGATSNGSGEYIFAGKTGGGQIRRAVLAFDLSSIPRGATITAAELTLYMSKTISGPKPVSLHRTLSDWGEGSSDAIGEEGSGAPSTAGDATWIHTFYSGSVWANPGGDFAAIASQTTLVDTVRQYTWPTGPGIVADVQAWVNDPPINYGWTLLGDESTFITAKRFNSRNSLDEDLRPLLRVSYQDPPIQALGTTWGRVKALMR